MRFFFYGTLIDDDVRALVLDGVPDRCAADGDPVPARLEGWRCACVRAKSYPAAVRRNGAVMDGVLTGSLSQAAVRRLVAYEGPEYERRSVTVLPARPDRGWGDGVDAEIFAAGPLCRTTPVDWNFETWQQRHKRRFLAELRGGRLV